MSAKEIQLEVCVDSVASALAAAEGGASRIELCAALSEGGLTPTVGVLQALKGLPLNIPIYCMLRPRRGNDFIYSQLEMDALVTDMQQLRAHGADGFVFGALTERREVDVPACRQVLRHAANLPVTFHRAFDLTNPAAMHDTLDCLKELGFRRLLSSGFCRTAAEGIDNLAQLVAKHHRDIAVMPGAGISVGNLDEILTVTKCSEFHASALAAAGEGEREASNGTATKMDCDVTMGKQDAAPYAVTDVRVVRKMVTIARAMAAK